MQVSAATCNVRKCMYIHVCACSMQHAHFRHLEYAANYPRGCTHEFLAAAKLFGSHVAKFLYETVVSYGTAGCVAATPFNVYFARHKLPYAVIHAFLTFFRSEFIPFLLPADDLRKIWTSSTDDIFRCIQQWLAKATAKVCLWRMDVHFDPSLRIIST